MRFCATGALLRAGFELTGDVYRANELCYDACARLLPHQETAWDTLQHLNDSSIGYCTVMRVFDEYLEGHTGFDVFGLRV